MTPAELLATHAELPESEQRALFDSDSNISQDEAFEIFDAAGVGEITWDGELNREFSQWQYLNIK